MCSRKNKKNKKSKSSKKLYKLSYFTSTFFIEKVDLFEKSLSIVQLFEMHHFDLSYIIIMSFHGTILLLKFTKIYEISNIIVLNAYLINA